MFYCSLIKKDSRSNQTDTASTWYKLLWASHVGFVGNEGDFFNIKKGKMELTKCRAQGSYAGIQVKAPHQELGLSSSWVYLEAWWKAHILGQVILVELSLRGWRHGSQAKSSMLHLRHILLEEHHVVHVLLTGHVDAQVPCHVGLVVTYLTPPSRFALRLGWRGGSTRYRHMGGGLCRMVVGSIKY